MSLLSEIAMAAVPPMLTGGGQYAVPAIAAQNPNDLAFPPSVPGRPNISAAPPSALINGLQQPNTPPAAPQRGMTPDELIEWLRQRNQPGR